MSFSFTIPSKRSKKPPATFSAVGSYEPPSSSSSTAKSYVSEFNAGEAPLPSDSKIKPIAAIPNEWRPTKKLKNLPNLPPLTQSNGEDAALQFELDPGTHPDPSDGSIAYGLNLRETGNGNSSDGGVRGESFAELELKKLRDDLDKLPDATGMDEYEDVPIEGFGAALLSGYGWKEGQGIGRNAKEDIVIAEVKRKAGRGGLGFTGDSPERVDANGGGGEKKVGTANVGREKSGERGEKKGFGVGKEVRIVNGREMGMKGKVVEVRSGGDLLVLRISKSDRKVKVGLGDVAELGSAKEEKFLRKLEELEKRGKKNVANEDRRDRNPSSQRSKEKERAGSESVNWLRNHIRVKVISKKLKGERLYLKKAVVVDVVGPGLCDISIDESRELVQGVQQELLETVVPKRGGPVLVLYGKHKGVYGSLLERNSEKGTGIVRDADTHAMLNVNFEQIAEFTGDPSDLGY